MISKTLNIRPDDLTNPQVLALLDEHLHEMAFQSPPESVHALDITELKKPNVRFWSAWTHSPAHKSGGVQELAGVAALKFLDATSAEVKSMRTNSNHRRSGVASRLVTHLINEARKSNIRTLFLETGAADDFTAARSLYLKSGFTFCEPYADYTEDPNSVFMQLKLSPGLGS